MANKMKVNVEQFKSIAQLKNTIDSRQLNQLFKEEREYDLASENGDEDFTGTKSYSQAEELLIKGWADPLEKMNKEFNKGSKIKADRKTKLYVTNDVVGCVPCVPRAIMGLPDSMIDYSTKTMPVKTMTIVYDSCASAYVKTNTLIENGIVILNLIKYLELQGYKVKLDLMVGTIKVREANIIRVSLKEFKQPLDLKKLAFPLANPSMLRRIFFKWLERTPKLTERRFTRGYGQPLAVADEEEIVEVLKTAIKKGEYYINLNDIATCKRDIMELMKLKRMAL